MQTMGSHLNPESFAEYTGHLIPVPNGQRNLVYCSKVTRLAKNLETVLQNSFSEGSFVKILKTG
jgi:hypothetical protein